MSIGSHSSWVWLFMLITHIDALQCKALGNKDMFASFQSEHFQNKISTLRIALMVIPSWGILGQRRLWFCLPFLGCHLSFTFGPLLQLSFRSCLISSKRGKTCFLQLSNRFPLWLAETIIFVKATMLFPKGFGILAGQNGPGFSCFIFIDYVTPLSEYEYIFAFSPMSLLHAKVPNIS